MKYTEPLELWISKQPFDVSSFWTKFNNHNKDEGNRSNFSLCFLLSKALYCLSHRTLLPTPPRRLAEMPKSKYYFSQMARYLHTRHNGAKLGWYTLTWRHHLKCPIYLSLCQSYLPLLSVSWWGWFKSTCEHSGARISSLDWTTENTFLFAI